MKLRFATTENLAAFLFDLETLIDTRLLIQANSGGGKSYLIRKILEVSHGKVQQIVLDLEGEFATLREKFDYLLAGKGGDIPTDLRTADLLARRMLELGTSIIIDLSELKQQEQKRYVRLFLEAVINAPKDLWHPCLIIVDEAHHFCPEKEEAESAGAVVDLLTRGRKRGYCGVLATQRLAKLNKDAAAECNNVLIGRTGLDVDMKRADDILGFTTREQLLSLRDLDPGQFYAFGPALSRKVVKVKVDQVLTTHPKVGARGMKITTPPAPEKIRAVLSKLTDLPQEAQRELKDREAMLTEIRVLRGELTRAKSAQGQLSPDQVREIEARAFDRGTKTAYDQWAEYMKRVERVVANARDALLSIGRAATTGGPNTLPEPPHPLHIGLQSPALRAEHDQIFGPPSRPVITSAPRSYHQTGDNSLDDGPLREGAMKMLRALAQSHPTELSRPQVSVLSGYSLTSSTFGTYLGELKRKGWIEEHSGQFRITEAGLTAAGPVDPLPVDPAQLLELWAGKFRDGAAKMLRFIVSKYPEYVTEEEISEATHFSLTSSTFGTYLGELKRCTLIEKEEKSYRGSPALCEPGNYQGGDIRR